MSQDSSIEPQEGEKLSYEDQLEISRDSSLKTQKNNALIVNIPLKIGWIFGVLIISIISGVLIYRFLLASGIVYPVFHTLVLIISFLAFLLYGKKALQLVGTVVVLTIASVILQIFFSPYSTFLQKYLSKYLLTNYTTLIRIPFDSSNPLHNFVKKTLDIMLGGAILEGGRWTLQELIIKICIFLIIVSSLGGIIETFSMFRTTTSYILGFLIAVIIGVTGSLNHLMILFHIIDFLGALGVIIIIFTSLIGGVLLSLSLKAILRPWVRGVIAQREALNVVRASTEITQGMKELASIHRAMKSNEGTGTQ